MTNMDLEALRRIEEKLDKQNRLAAAGFAQIGSTAYGVGFFTALGMNIALSREWTDWLWALASWANVGHLAIRHLGG